MIQRILLTITDESLRQAIETCSKLESWQLAEFDPDFLTSVFSCLLLARAEIAILRGQQFHSSAFLDCEIKCKRYEKALKFYAEGKHITYESDDFSDISAETFEVIENGEVAREALE